MSRPYSPAAQELSTMQELSTEIYGPTRVLTTEQFQLSNDTWQTVTYIHYVHRS